MNPYENSHTYRTGSTNPPKNHRGLITLLLILVILLITAVAILSMMNVRLFRLLEAQDDHPVEFSEAEIAPASYNEPIGLESADLGMTIQEIAQLYRSYNEWPQGVYISNIHPDGPAANSDLRPGDIVVALNGNPISGSEDFIQQLENLGNTIELTVFRDSQEMVIALNIED